MSKYRVRLTLPAVVEVVVDVDATSQQEAIVSGYDHAMAATPSTVTVVSLSRNLAQLETCDQVSAADELPAEQPPVESARYLVLSFETPQTFADGKPSVRKPFSDYNDAVAHCRNLETERDAYCRLVRDKFSNTLYEHRNEVGGFVVVAFADAGAYARRSYVVWSGWRESFKQAKTEALSLLDAGKVFAVGVVDASSQGGEPRLMMSLTRSN